MGYYVVAGGSTVSRAIKRLIENGIWTKENFRRYLNDTTEYYLTSIGEPLNRKKKFNRERFVKQVVKLYNEVYGNEYFNDTKSVVDSGGYQISIGYIKEDDIPEFIDAYIDLLTHPNVGVSSSYMLSLDIVADYPYITSVEKLKELNQISIEKTIQHDTDKVYFVYHFVNPRLEQFWWSNFVEPYFDYFNNYSIGGLVAFARHSDFPFNVYSLPLLKIITRKIQKQKYDPFVFHILGVSSFTDIFSFIVFEKFLKKVYDIEVTINFDSTRAVRETALAKRLQIYVDGTLVPVSYRSSALHHRVYKDYTNGQLLAMSLGQMIDKYDINIDLPKDELKPSDLYKNDGKGGIYTDIETLICLLSTLSIQQTIEVYNQDADQLVKAVLDGDTVKAEEIASKTMTKTNFNKKTKKTIAKARALLHTLEFIKEKPSIETLNNLMLRAMEGVHRFKLLDDKQVESNHALLDIF